MAKITKRQTKLHDEAMDLVNKVAELTFDQKEFILENYKPHANNNVTKVGAFYTPPELASVFTQEMPEPYELDRPVRILDLCAGIGNLSYSYYWSNTFPYEPEIVCVELLEESVKVGKKILPQAKWIQGDITDPKLFMGPEFKEKFDCVISNPPFGNIKVNGHNWKAPYNVAKLMSHYGRYGVLILPQTLCPFKVSGFKDRNQYGFEEVYNKTYNSFSDINLVKFSPTCIDTQFASELWEEVALATEIVIVEKLGKSDI